jgi:glutathione S-transferase
VTDLILHQYEMSPFSEKARRLFAWKKLPWKAVRAPAVMPKPDVVALTGGYRKTPVLQIGNHVYCDTALIARVLERFAPEPTFFPSPVAESLAEWADTTLFEVTVPVAMRPTRFDDVLQHMKPEELGKIQEDRAAMREGARRKPPPLATAKAHLAVYLARLDRTLAAQPFLLGEQPCIADFSAYHSAWFLQTMVPEPLESFSHLRAWLARIAAIPMGPVTPFTSEEALRVCRESPRELRPTGAFEDAGGLELGKKWIVRAVDYGRDPVEGELVHATADEVALRREDPRAGTVFVHFPRLGYEIAEPRGE